MNALIMALRADPASLSVVRERMRRWLAALYWPGEEIDDVVMATNEAFSCAVAHALANGIQAEVRVAGRLFTDSHGHRRVLIGVAGDGRWQPEPAEADFDQFSSMMLHTCMDAVQSCHDGAVTTVLMTSVSVPPLR